MPLASILLPALLDAASEGDHDLATAIADLSDDASVPEASEPLGDDGEAERARARLNRRMLAYMGWRDSESVQESAMAVSTGDFAGLQTLQVTGKGQGGAKGHRHLEEDEDEKPHKFSSTQFYLPNNVAARVLAMARRIKDEHLAEDGREDAPHVTARFGLHTDDADEVRDAVRGHGPVRVRLGKTSLFPDSETGKGYEVVKIDVSGDGLHRLHRTLGNLEHTDTHPVYQPHITLGYLKPGEGHRYEGMDDLDGVEVPLSELIFSDRERNKTAIPLEGGLFESEETDHATRADLAGHALAEILAGDRDFSAAELAGMLDGLRPEDLERVRLLAGISQDEWDAAGEEAKPGTVLVITEDQVTDKLGRKQCYDDTTGKHIPCGAGGEGSGKGKPAQAAAATGNAPKVPAARAFASPGDSQAVAARARGETGHELFSKRLGGNRDRMLEDIVREAGKDGPPAKATRAQMDELKKKGWKIAYRGVSRPEADEGFRNGEYFAGSGIFGNGIYVQAAAGGVAGMLGVGGMPEDKAAAHAKGYGEHLSRIAIPPNARIANHSDILAEQKKYQKQLNGRFASGEIGREEYETQYAVSEDVGRMAALLNYDAVWATWRGYYCVLNRAMLVVQED